MCILTDFWQFCNVKFGDRSFLAAGLQLQNDPYHLDYGLSLCLDRNLRHYCSTATLVLVTLVLLKLRIYTLHACKHMSHSMHHTQAVI